MLSKSPLPLFLPLAGVISVGLTIVWTRTACSEGLITV
jgi:hypothetical protein